jgi:hypothetical protein
MSPKEKQDLVDRIEFQLSNIKDQDLLYSTFKELLFIFPNDSELGITIRNLFTSNIN